MEEEDIEELGTSSVKTEIMSHVELVILKYDFKNYH